MGQYATDERKERLFAGEEEVREEVVVSCEIENSSLKLPPPVSTHWSRFR